MAQFRDIEDVKAEMRRRGLTSVSISKSSGVPESTIRMAMIGRPSRKGEEAIADALKLPLHEVFPSGWDAAGNRLQFRSQDAKEQFLKGFNDRLKAAVGERRISDLARSSGIPPSTCRNYLSGRTEPTIEATVRLAQALDVTLEWLLTGLGVPQKSGAA